MSLRKRISSANRSSSTCISPLLLLSQRFPEIFAFPCSSRFLLKAIKVNRKPYNSFFFFSWLNLSGYSWSAVSETKVKNIILKLSSVSVTDSAFLVLKLSSFLALARVFKDGLDCNRFDNFPICDCIRLWYDCIWLWYATYMIVYERKSVYFG